MPTKSQLMREKDKGIAAGLTNAPKAYWIGTNTLSKHDFITNAYIYFIHLTNLSRLSHFILVLPPTGHLIESTSTPRPSSLQVARWHSRSFTPWMSCDAGGSRTVGTLPRRCRKRPPSSCWAAICTELYLIREWVFFPMFYRKHMARFSHNRG